MISGVRVSRGIVYKSTLSSNRRSPHVDVVPGGILIRKYLKGRHIPEHAQFEVIIYKRQTFWICSGESHANV